MRTEDIKKMNKDRVRRIRPRNCPSCFLFLKSSRVMKENRGLLEIKNEATVLGCYGTKKERGSWLHLVKEGTGYVWIFDNAIAEIKEWSEELQGRYDNKEFEKRPIPKVNITLTANQLMILLRVNGEEQELVTDLKGKLQTPQKGFTIMKDYLAHLTETYGSKAVSYEYKLQVA